MRYLTSSERRVKGPVLFQERLPAPKHQFQQVAVLAFPTPREESNTISSHSPSVSCTPDVADASLLVDGDRQTKVMFPAGAGDGTKAFLVVLATDQPFVARSVELVPTATDFSVNCELQVAEDSGAFRTVRKFPIDRSNNRISVGFLPHSPPP